ncbi:hypothetical protein PMAYCL1PPCAC_16743, partial [Pristionchus mayeri]
TEASLKALNDRLEKPANSINFRPNIVVDQTAPCDEDKWADIRIGDVRLLCCAMCIRQEVLHSNGGPGDGRAGTGDATTQGTKRVRTSCEAFSPQSLSVVIFLQGEF